MMWVPFQMSQPAWLGCRCFQVLNNSEWALIPNGCLPGGSLPPECKTSSAHIDESRDALIHRGTCILCLGKASYCPTHLSTQEGTVNTLLREFLSHLWLSLEDTK